MMSDLPPSERLSAELEAAALRALRRTWDQLNLTHFKGRLRRATVELSDGRSRLGLWLRENRTIRLSRAVLVDHGWGTAVEVLKHEMAHQYVDEVLGLAEESAHGPAFRQACAERGIDPRAAGAPGGEGLRTPAHERLLERVAGLLALAGSPNEHEARSAAAAAQRLMLKYNLEELALGVAAPHYGFRHLGRPTGRVDESRRLLANILADHFFVESIWVPVWRPREGKRGSVLEIIGSAANLELAEYVYAFLDGTADRLWREHRRERSIRGDRDRRTFRAGVMAGFAETLGTQHRASREAGLVWVGDRDLRGHLRRRYPHIRWTRHGGQRRTPAYAEGREAGRRIVLRRGVTHGPSGGTPLLPGR
jgi:hypothetical protein